jgi:methanogenic corrinoid protein MtbC1
MTQTATDPADPVDALVRALLDLDRVAARALVPAEADGTLSVDVLERVVVPALVRIGLSWEEGDVALSQVYMSGRMCENLIDVRVPRDQVLRASQPRIAVGVLHDSHVLGKQIVVQMLRSAGYRVSDLGARLGVDDIVSSVLAEEIEVLVLSVLMLRSALDVAAVHQRLRETGRRVTIVVGGAPFRFDPALAAEVGADYSGASASDILTIMADIERSRS